MLEHLTEWLEINKWPLASLTR